MAQPIKNKGVTVKQKPKKKVARKPKVHPQYGSSKLEDKFAKEFLDKLSIKYIRQFEAKSIKRFYDFYCPDSQLLIEVDGDYYHSKGLIYEEMSPMQKKNHRVDKIKDEWAMLHGIPLIRIWEEDINKHPMEVMAMLKERFYIAEKQKKINDDKKKRH